MKFGFIEDHRAMWPLKAMCRMLGVSKAGYFRWRDHRESPRASADRALTVRIRAIHDQHRRVYGSPRIHRHLGHHGIHVGRKRVARLMRVAKIQVHARRRFRRTTDSNHDHPIAANLLAQDFSATAPNTRWVTDITYIPTDAGWLYLAAIIDLFSRRVVGWAMDTHLERSLVLRALEAALGQRATANDLIHHSDRGCQYASQDYRAALAVAGIQASMSRRGNCYDNAVIESFWHSLKVELVHRCRFATRAQAEAEIFEYIEVFYNRQRLHSTLGYQTPAAFEAAHNNEDIA